VVVTGKCLGSNHLRSGTVDVEGLFTSRAGKVIHSGEVEIAGAVSERALP